MPLPIINPPATHLVAGVNRAGERFFYTGRAGEAFVSRDLADAYVGWYESGAAMVAQRLNRTSSLHGITFTAIEAPTANEIAAGRLLPPGSR